MDGPGLPCDPAQFQQYGQELYRRGDYNKAIEAFTQALKNKHTDALGVLDNRSATYCKLGNFDLALRDAKQMIRRDKHDERGYLRAAKALLLGKQPEKAIEVYAYSLKTLPKDHPRRDFLQQLHHKLQDKMAARFHDPFDVLPLEIALMVLRCLNFKQVVAILRVSKKWTRFLSSVRELWQELDLSGARSSVSITAVRSCVRRAKGALTRAVIDHVIPTTMDKVLELLSRCPDLTHLEVAGQYDGDKLYNLFKTSKKLKVLIISSQIRLTRQCMVSFLRDIPSLERFEVGGSMYSVSDIAHWSGRLPNLKAMALAMPQIDFPPVDPEVELPYYGFIDNDTSDAWLTRRKEVFESVPNLEELSLSSTPKKRGQGYFVNLKDLCYPKLRRLTLSGLEFLGEPQFTPNLEYLSIHRCDWNVRHESVHPFQPHLPNLTTLVLNDIPWMTSSHLSAFLKTEEPTLKVLEVRCCFKISASDIVRAAFETSALKKVQTLSLEGMYELDDKAITQILEETPCLQTLNIPDTSVTGMTIKTIADMRIAEKERRNTQKMMMAVGKDGASPPASPQPSSSYDLDAGKDQKPLVEILNVKGCQNVSLDAVEFGRKRGLKIIR